MGHRSHQGSSRESRYRTDAHPFHVLVAPDKFAGTLTAKEAARAIGHGVRSTCRATMTELPLADGGEGTLDVLVAAWHGSTRTASAADTLGRAGSAVYGVCPDGTRVVEMAAASGLRTLGHDERDSLAASSRGTGELMRAAVAEGRAVRLVVAVGGSASTDGGTGAARVFGWRFLDANGRDLADGGGSLVHLARIVPPQSGSTGLGVPVVGAVDVLNPLVGHSGAARVFAPQKGATASDVEVLDAGLRRLHERLVQDVGVDVGPVAGGGAGGGFGAGLVAFFDASLQPGFDLVADAVHLDDHLRAADLVITGEGRLDESSLRGKAPVALARRARAAGVPCLVIAGEVALSDDAVHAAGFARATALDTHVCDEPNEAVTAAARSLVAPFCR